MCACAREKKTNKEIKKGRKKETNKEREKERNKGREKDRKRKRVCKSNVFVIYKMHVIIYIMCVIYVHVILRLCKSNVFVIYKMHVIIYMMCVIYVHVMLWLWFGVCSKGVSVTDLLLLCALV